MAKRKGYAGRRSSSMDGSYGRIDSAKDLYSISELHITEVSSPAFGYERVAKPSVTRSSSFTWSRGPSKRHLDLETDPQPEAEEESQQKKKKKLFGIKSFLTGILDSYKKLLQSAEDSNVHLADLYPSNSIVAPVTPAAGNRGIKYISPSPGVGRRSLGRVAEEPSRMQLDESALEIQAKEAAVQKVAKLLPLPDSLASLKKIREDYASRLQRNDALLTASVMNQVEHTKAGIEAVSQAKVTVKQLRENFLLIDKLCDECRTLIDNHDQINLLSHARNNLNKTFTDVQGMMSISTLAANARESLKDEKELVQTFEALTALEQKRRFALAAVSTRMEEASRLSAFFEDVRETRTIFEQTLWNHIRNYFQLAKTSVVEMQEIADQQQDEEEAEADNIEPIVTSPNGDSSVPGESLISARKESLIRRSLSLPASLEGRRAGLISVDGPITRRGYKDRCYVEIQKSIEERFTNLLETSVAGDLTTALQQATVVAQELSANFNYVAPCFPPRYQIFQVIVQSYTERFVQMLRKLSDRASDLSNQEILKVTEWVLQYQEQLLSLGVEEMLASVCAESGAMDPLFTTYILRMKGTMQRMCSNILDADRVNPPKRTESGRLWTPSCVDLFRLLNEQVKVVQETSTDVMLFHVAVAINQLMLEFQGAEKWRLQSEHPLNIGLENLCAMANNNVRCHEMTNDMSTSILEDLPLSYVEQVSFDDASQGFLAVAKYAVQLAVRVIFEDPGVKELLAKLYLKDWLDCMVTEYLIPTFEDYFEDIKMYLEEKYFQKYVEFCIEETVVIYIDRLLIQRNYIKEETLKRMKQDREMLSMFFREIISYSKVEKRLQPLADIWELASSESVDAYTLAYTNLLQNHPDCQPEVVEKLVAMRVGIPWKDARAVVAECKELYASSLRDGNLPKPGLVFSKLTALPKSKQIKK